MIQSSLTPSRPLTATATSLAINLLYLMVWGFAGIAKLRDGAPPWFGEKFGTTFLATIPGLHATFWILTLSELAALALAVMALVRLEFLRPERAMLLPACLVWSLFVFLQLGFGQWLTGEFNGAFQQFVYFAATLLCLLCCTPPPRDAEQHNGPGDAPVTRP